MEMLSLFLLGLELALQPENLAYAFAGCVIGTLVGVLPGVGPVAGIAILLPLTFNLSPVGAAIEGYQMARQGRAGAALAIAAIGSFIGGCIATAGIVVLTGPLSRLGLSFGPPEFFGLVLLSFTLLVGLTSESVFKGFVAAAFGLALTLPGLDPMTGIARMTFGSVNMLEGFSFVPLLMGLFGISEILLNIEQKQRKLLSAPMSSLFLTWEDWKRSLAPIARGTGVGFFIGVIPGLGSATASFLSYALEKRVAHRPEQFGHGAIEGVAGPETANNASANGAMLPLLTLGIPGSATTALLMGAFLINGIRPGPFLFAEHTELVWTLIASMIVGNAILLILNLPLVGLWARILLIPYPVLMTAILVFTIVGSYSLNGSLFDVAVMLVFGVVGYVMRKTHFPMAPIALTLVLGRYFEQSLRQSLVLSQGDFSIFLRSPISTTLVVVAGAMVALLILRAFVTRYRGWQGQDSEV